MLESCSLGNHQVQRKGSTRVGIWGTGLGSEFVYAIMDLYLFRPCAFYCGRCKGGDLFSGTQGKPKPAGLDWSMQGPKEAIDAVWT